MAGDGRADLNLSPDAHFHIAESVNEYLSDWLTHHILLTDMQYKGRLG
jgi:hemerythrin